MSERTCSVEGCERPFYARDVCQGHYKRLIRGVPLNRPFKVGRYDDRPCSMESCNEIARSHGLCALHYQRQRLGIDITLPRKSKPGGPCSVTDCEAEARIKGMCRRHYGRSRYGRDMDVPFRKQRPDGSGTYKGGYHYVRRDGRWIPAHRVVMERVLGRPLLDHENVHHINGIKDDNRPDNLELWVVSQPKGQRPDDLAAWVVEHYPELVEAALVDRRQLRLAI